MNKVERLKSLESLFLMLSKQAEEIRGEIIKRAGLIDLQYDCVRNKPVYVAEGIDDGISCGYVHYGSVDELRKYHVV